MNEYYPSYIKDYYENKKKCPKCNNDKFNIKEKLICSYLDECNKCSRMSLYGENQINNLNSGYIPTSYYTEMCTCRNRNVYSKIIKCSNCIKCENCKEELMSWASNDSSFSTLPPGNSHLRPIYFSLFLFARS